MDDWRAELWTALVALLVALGASLRARLKRGERVFPRVRLRGYFSIRSPSDHPRRGAPDIEIFDSSARPPRMSEAEREATTAELERVENDEDEEDRETLKPRRRRRDDDGT